MGIFETKSIKMNIGAGDKIIDGWISVGLDPHHEIKADIRRIPVADNYADEAMAIHVIEHVFLVEVPNMLREWFRILKPGGILAVECPDLLKCCRNVLDGLSEKMGMRGLYGEFRGTDETMLHRWLPTHQHLQALLSDAGFIKIREEQPIYHGRRLDRDLRIVCRKPQSA